MKKSGFSFNDKKSKFSLQSELRYFKPILIEEVSKNWLKLLILSERKLITLLQVLNNPNENNHHFKNNDRDLSEAHIKSLHEMEELKRVQESRINEFLRGRLIENQDTINELTARLQEQQNEVNCVNDSRDFKDAESVRSGLSHVTNQPASLTSNRDPGGLPSRNDRETFL